MGATAATRHASEGKICPGGEPRVRNHADSWSGSRSQAEGRGRGEGATVRVVVKVKVPP